MTTERLRLAALVLGQAQETIEALAEGAAEAGEAREAADLDALWSELRRWRQTWEDDHGLLEEDSSADAEGQSMKTATIRFQAAERPDDWHVLVGAMGASAYVIEVLDEVEDSATVAVPPTYAEDGSEIPRTGQQAAEWCRGIERALRSIGASVTLDTEADR